ncbi:IPTL-CTERM sorting domain-containing protein [Pseudomonadota bacterium]
MVNLRPGSFRKFQALALFLAFIPGIALAVPPPPQGIIVGLGATAMLTTSDNDWGCGDLVVNGEMDLGTSTQNRVRNVVINPGGTLKLESGTINMSGNWINNGGTVDPTGTSQVTWNEECGSGDIQILGDSAFHHLSVATGDNPTQRTIIFGAGDTTTVHGKLVLTGKPGTLLLIRSSTPGTPAFLIVDADQVLNEYYIRYVNVQDNHAQVPGEWIDWGPPQDFGSIDGPGNYRWFRSGAEDGLMYFQATKIFTDGNTGSVTVNIHCNIGTIGPDSKPLSSAYPVAFVVSQVDATIAGPNCRVWEEPQAGYSAVYAVGECNADSEEDFTGGCEAVNTGNLPGCYYTDVHYGADVEWNYCQITNTPDPVEVEVTKVWDVTNTGGDYFSRDAKITIGCNAEISPYSWKKNGNWYYRKDLHDGDYVDGQYTVTVEVIPEYPSSFCFAGEDNVYSAVEVSSDCGDRKDPGMKVSVGHSDSCTITNTLFFEGIPTLNQWGMAMLALLMLGVGFIGIRRLT